MSDAGVLRKLFSTKTGIAGTVLGLTAAGLAAGVAAERYLVRRSRRGDDPYADEPFGALPATESYRLVTENGVELHVEIVEPDADAEPDAEPDADADADAEPGVEADAGADDLTIVFVHGFCLDMGTFHFQRAALSGRYRMVFYDQPGHGSSGRITKGEYTLDGLGAALRTVINSAVPQGRFVLVGHSMGGMAIMAFAERWPELVAERVAGVAFMSTSAGDMDEVEFGMPHILARFRRPLLPAVRTAAPIASAVVDRARHATTDLAWLLTRKYGFGTARPSPSLVSYVERMNSATSLDVIARYLNTIYGHDRILALAPFRTVPVLVLCGDRDYVTPLDHSREIAKALPDAQLVVVADGGHVSLLEHADEVNEVLLGFLRTVGGL